MRSPLRLLGMLAFLITLALLAAIYVLPADFGPGAASIRVNVEPGLSSAAIGRKLEEAGVIRSGPAFRIAAAVSGRASRLRAGPYEFRPSETIWGVLDRMVRGDVLQTVLTIPEGWNSREIAARVAELTGCRASDFLALVGDSTLVRKLGLPGNTLEGYLFPDTYHVIPGTRCEDLVRRFVTRTLEVYGASFAARSDSLGLDRHRVLTLASLVEAEAAVAEERPRIAAVFLNRLRLGMKLQSDPTVAYALGVRPSRIFEKDLAVDSPYNTYLVYGLPPGPICSPGVSALRAVLDPLPDCRDLYFVATGDGHHLFSETNAAHNEARRRVAAGRRSGQGGE